MRLLLIILPLLISNLSLAQKKIRLFDEESKMREELLRHFPIGTDTSSIVQEMTDNKFETYRFYQEELWKESKKIYDQVDYFTFRRTKSTSFWISTTWMIKMLFNDQGKITEVVVEIGYTGP